MKPKATQNIPQQDLFRSRLDNIINMDHALVRLANSVDWKHLEEKVSVSYAKEGRPGLPARLIVGLHILKQMYNLSDEGTCERWEHDPYFQYFCGETFFQHRFPIERSSMTHFRKRVGENFFITLLQESLNTAYKLGALEIKQVEKVAVDTTVQPKAIAFPTDAKLRYKAITKLVALAKKCGFQLRQSYVRVGKQMLIASCRYRHAKQMKRAKKAESKLNTWLGRIIREIKRKLRENMEMIPQFKEALVKADQIHTQTKEDANKLYSWHAPEVECISKGKAHKPYEFGCKVSVTTNINPAPAGHFILHTAALHGKPYDGHTLNGVLEEMKSQTGIDPKRIYVDKGYRGHKHPKKFRVYMSGQRRGVTAAIKKELKRRSVVEPVIGHAKSDGRLGRNYLYGTAGDRMNALMVAAGYNFRLILKWLRLLFFFFYLLLLDLFFPKNKNPVF